MAKFHITKKGEPGACAAQYSCPLGNDTDHFETKEAAQQAYEAKMVAELVPAGASKSDLGASQLSGLAKVSSDPDVIEEVMTRGSDRALRNLAKNPNLNAAQLAMAHSLEKASEATRAALAAHPNFPVSQMSVSEWTDQLRNSSQYDRTESLIGSDAVTDAHLDALAAHKFKSEGKFPHNISINKALANPYNQLSGEKLVQFGEQSFTTIGAAMQSGRYPADRIPSLPKNLVYWANIDNTSNPEYLSQYAQWAVAHSSEDKYVAQSVASHVARNPETPSGTLQSLAENGLATVDVYKNPRATDEVRALCEFADDEVGRVAKLDRLQDQFGGKLREELVYMERTDQPYANRGLHDTRVRFNTERMAELGLDAQDILTLMGRNKYNGGVSFDPKTGIFNGTVDSTD